MSDYDKPRDGIKFEFDNVFRFNPQNYGGLLLYQIGELCCEPSYEIQPHQQWCNEISYIVSGSGEFSCNGKIFNVKSGDVFISPLGVVHGIKASSSEQLRFAFIGFDFTSENQLEVYSMINGFFSSANEYIVHDMQDIMIPFYRVIDEFYNKSQHGEVMIQSYIVQILVMTYRAFTFNTGLKYHAEDKNKAVGQTVYAVMAYVEKNIFGNKSVSDIAKALGYNECYLSHVFKQKTGQTLQNYILSKKIIRSIEIFKLGNCSVTDMAANLGYVNVQSYSRAFKRMTGLYPTQYIEQYCGKA